ncbi:MAG: NAD(P)H-quinone oxidoreductase [Desulfobacterales bacterium]
MKAIQTLKSGHEIELVWSGAVDPEPGPEDVVVAVRAAGVNRADLLQAQGLYPPPEGESRVLGLEIAGDVLRTGRKVTEWHVGDRVLALVPGGGYAEFCRVDSSLLMPIPADWSYAEAAAVPEAWLTAFSNLFMEGGLTSGEAVLIHAGASGVGTAAIQMAKSAGAWVATTCGSDEKCSVCRELGADLAVNYRSESFPELLTKDRFQLVLDCVGAPYLSLHLDVLAIGGRWVLIGVMGGRKAEIDLAKVLMKDLRLQGSRLRSRSVEAKSRIIQSFKSRFWTQLVSGRLRPVIDRTFPIEQATQAHRHVKENRNIGKVVLTLEKEPVESD